jgi:hypothetical protein
MSMCKTFGHNRKRNDVVTLDGYQRLEKRIERMQQRIEILEANLGREVSMIHEYLKVSRSYTPAESKLVKVKKASQ